MTKLAATVGCSKSVEKIRLEKLLADGIIRFVSVVDPKALGYNIGLVILIKSQPDKIYAIEPVSKRFSLVKVKASENFNPP